MNVSTIRAVDRWVGVPVCFLLTVLRRCGNVLRALRRRATGEPRRILFIKLAEQGATVLAWPAIRRAVEMVGRENVYFLVFEENRFILDALDAVDHENVIAIPTGRITRTVRGALGACRRLRKLGIDAAVDMEFFARGSAALAYLSGAKMRVGFHSFFGEAHYRGDLMTHRLSYNPHLHAGRIFQVMVDALRHDPNQLPALDTDAPADDNDVPTVTPDADELERVRELLSDQAGTDSYRPLVLLNANASDLMPLRRWPEQRYVEVARRLIERSPDVRVAFTGAPNEAVAAERLAGQVDSPRCFSLAGKTTLRELLVAYTQADVLVTNDSGPAHFAVLTPIRVITLFGPETPALFGARTSRNHVLYSDVPCSPCVNAYNDRQSACPNNVCMQRISADEVFEKVCELADL